MHSVVEDLGEVLEAEALPTSPLVGHPYGIQRSKRCFSWRGPGGGSVIAARGDTIIKAGDKVIYLRGEN